MTRYTRPCLCDRPSTMFVHIHTKYGAGIERLRAAVLEGSGTLPPEVRAACADNAAPAPLAPYVDKVVRNAYSVVDADVEALRRAGYPEDEIFEVTVSAALGAGLRRLEVGLVALEANR